MKHKSKHPTPQEIYRERVRREEEERDAFLPPGLINHGNTCFMNSTLQGLIATPLLHSLINFEQLPLANASLAARRSPQLTNGHGRGGPHEQERVQGMPLGDVFVTLMQRAWDIQQAHRRESMSPKDLLTIIGRKYDQYLDFRQQDAHEFLRHMLDAMRMEELDVIKARQPPPPKGKRRKSQRAATMTPKADATPDPAPSLPQGSVGVPPDPKDAPSTSGTSAVKPDESEKLESFVDMIFGGKFASFLVCDACKKVSITYEDFNDLSLSIKPEDYVKERKRDRFKLFAKKLGFKPKDLDATAVQRSSSVPASPARRSMDPLPHDPEPPLHLDQRRRSLDHPASGAPGSPEESDPKEGIELAAGATSAISVPPSGAVTPQPAEELAHEPEKTGEVNKSNGKPPGHGHGHVGFAETTRGDKAKEKGDKERGRDDTWGKLGRRISVSMGKSKKDKEKRPLLPKEHGWRNPRLLGDDKSVNSRTASEERSGTAVAVAHTSAPDSGSSDLGDVSDISKSRGFTPSPGPSPLASPSLNASMYSPIPNPRRLSALSLTDKLTKPITPSRPPKPTREELAYMRQVLADVHSSSQSTFSVLHQALSHSSSNLNGAPANPVTAQALLAKLGQIPGIEECLKLFTAVEILDGENMVGCHRCWKIANGTYVPKENCDPDCVPLDDSREDSEEEEPKENGEALPAAAVPVANTSQGDITTRTEDTESSKASTPDPQSEHVSPASTPNLYSATSSSLFLHETASVASAPTTIQSTPPKEKPRETMLSIYGGIPIPSISTTGPDTPDTSAPPTARVPSTPSSQNSSHADVAGSLRPPHSRTLRRRKKQDGLDYSSDSSDDDDGDTTTDVSVDSSLSDASSLASPSASPTVSPRPSLEKLRESVAALKPPTAAPNTSSSSSKRDQAANGKTPRSQQVILRKTFKRYLIAVPPPILVIHLKRFQQVSKSSSYAMTFSSGFKKLDDFVSFPEYLDLAPFLAPDRAEFGLAKKGKERARGRTGKGEQCMYRLYAVVVHIGNMLGGHYVAYTALPPSGSLAKQSSYESSSSSSASDSAPKSTPHEPDAVRASDGSHSRHKKQTRQWAYISDQAVRLTTLEEVLKAKAYICMYERI